MNDKACTFEELDKQLIAAEDRFCKEFNKFDRGKLKCGTIRIDYSAYVNKFKSINKSGD